MDLVSTILGLVIFALMAAPFVLTGRGRKKIEKRLLTSLKTMASGGGRKLTEYNFGNLFAIGLSDDKQYVFFASESKKGEANQAITLLQIARCSANTVARTVGEGNNKSMVIDQLELVFHHKDPKQPAQKLLFFDIDDNLQLDNEMELLRKWEKRVSTVIAELKTVKPMATV